MQKKITKKPTSNGILVLIRHGESLFNKLNLFTGWIDVPLTKNGIKEAQQVASHCQSFNYDAAFSSDLERAHETLLIILSCQKKIGIFQHQSNKWYTFPKNTLSQFNKKILPIYPSKAFNERAYGILQGMNKKEAAKKYSKPQIFKWRRGYNNRPPQGESLEDVYKRAVPHFEKMIMPRLKCGEANLIVSHGNTLRAIIKYIENIDDNKIPFVNLPFASPLVYEYNKIAGFKRIEGTYDFKRVAH